MAGLPEHERRLYWRAVEALREAEATAGIAAKVSGPADGPPAPGAEASWVKDFTARAKRALQIAGQLFLAPGRAGHTAATRIARRVAEAARNVAATAVGKTSAAVHSVANAAGAMVIAGSLATLSVVALAVYLAVKLLR